MERRECEIKSQTVSTKYEVTSKKLNSYSSDKNFTGLLWDIRQFFQINFWRLSALTCTLLTYKHLS